ncbi:hypothetical protein EJB05_53114 [Eragrostis curvula]|nr:hypothetical protein EJB05_53114 [Eragrostis curvula]
MFNKQSSQRISLAGPTGRFAVHFRQYLHYSVQPFPLMIHQIMYQESLIFVYCSIRTTGTEIPMQPSVSFEDFCISVSTEDDRVIKIQVNVAGTMTDSTFEEVFAKKVAAAQPLPGFRRMKGGKTQEIPKEIALHIIGPSKVKRETIQKIINCTVAEYVKKEGLNALKNLKVQQSYEELEAAFEPGKEFCFDAVIHVE